MKYNGVKPKLQVANLSDFCDNFFQLGKKILNHAAVLQLTHIHQSFVICMIFGEKNYSAYLVDIQMLLVW